MVRIALSGQLGRSSSDLGVRGVVIAAGERERKTRHMGGFVSIC
jgi:hypothetical protein